MPRHSPVLALIAATLALSACGWSPPEDAQATLTIRDAPRLLVDLPSELPDGHPPVPGYSAQPTLPAGHPPIPGYQSAPALPEGHLRCPAREALEAAPSDDAGLQHALPTATPALIST